MDDNTLRVRARTLAADLEPVIGQVYFSPEAHKNYEQLGFAPSPGTIANNVALPDGPAYFTSRGSLLGHVAPLVVASAFGVFKPEVVGPCVAFGWSITDAPTIFAARREGAVAQLERVCGASDAHVDHAVGLLERTVEPLTEAGRPLFAGLRSQWDDSQDQWTRLFHLGDMLREFHGDAHVSAWSAAGLDAPMIGLLTELYIGLPLRTYVRTRAWSDEELDAAVGRLNDDGWLAGEEFTAEGRTRREALEVATDQSMRPAINALGDDFEELMGLLEPWGAAMRAAGGYIGGAGDLWPDRN